MVLALFIGLICVFAFTMVAIFHKTGPDVSGGLQFRFSILFICGFGLAPIIIAYFYTLLLWSFPGYGAEFYRAMLMTLAMPATVLLFKLRRAMNNFGRIQTMDGAVFSGVERVLLFFFVLVLAALFVQVAILPPTGNDTLEYLQAARLLDKTKDLSIYPVIDTDRSGGFYGPWSHPPGYAGLMALSFLFQGSREFAGLAKYWNFYYLILTCFLLFIITWSFTKNRLCALGSSFLLITTPIYFWQASVFHVDSIRCFLFLLGLFAYAIYWQYPDRRNAVLVSLTCALAIFIHSLGLIILPFLVLAEIVRIRNLQMPYRSSFKLFSMIILFLLVFNGRQVWINFSQTGQIVADTANVRSMRSEAIGYQKHLMYERGLNGGDQLFLRGVLKGFTKNDSFGFAYYTLLLGLLLCWWRKDQFLKENFRRDPTIKIFFISVGGFYILVIATLLLGTIELVKNDRYFLTIHPIVCCLAGVVWGRGWGYREA